MSDNQAVPSWMQTLRTLEKKLEENGVKQSSFLNKYENVWSNILYLSYTNDKRHLWNHPYAIRARNASLTSDVVSSILCYVKNYKRNGRSYGFYKIFANTDCKLNEKEEELKDGEKIDSSEENNIDKKL